MRIVYLHQYFLTPSMLGDGSAGTRSYEMGRRLACAGHNVEIVTSDTRMARNAGKRGWLITEESGMRVHWLSIRYSNKMSIRDRLVAFGKFALGSSRYAASLKADVVFASSTPLTIALPALYCHWRQRVPMIFEVRDLWPEAPIQMGALRNRLLIYLARRLESTTYNAAAQVIGLSPGICNGIRAAGVPEQKISLIPNSCDLETFNPSVEGGDWRRRLRIDGRHTLFLYFGAMGAANGLQELIVAARSLHESGDRSCIFALIGDGRERHQLEAAAKGLANMRFLGPFPKREMPTLVAAADVCLTLFRDIPILHTCSPNKFFDAISAGKPVLTNMRGWIADLVIKHECGAVVNPGDSQALARAALQLAKSRHELIEMGRRARILAELEFSREKTAFELLKVLERCGSA